MVLEKCGVVFTGQTHISKGNFPFNLDKTLSIVHDDDAFHAIEQERLLFRL